MTGQPFRVLLVDDEPLARASQRLILEQLPGVQIAGEAGSAAEAVSAIGRLAPDLVLLDITMQDADGFSVIEAVGVDLMPSVVFVTAHDAHALRAFEVHAVDYVLKPFEDERLIAAVTRVRDQAPPAGSGLGDKLGQVLETLRQDAGHRWPRRILIRDDEEIRFEKVDRIDYLQAANNTVLVHVGSATHRVRSTLSSLAARLDPQQFVRIHRSTVVNLDRVEQIQPWFGGDYVATLIDGTRLRISRTYRDEVLRPTR